MARYVYMLSVISTLRANMYTLSDFDFTLPPELIAQVALPQRGSSRLLEVNPRHPDSPFVDRRFTELLDLLSAGDLLVFNDTKVLNARLLGHKASGGKVEVLIERITSERTALAQIRASKRPRPGSTLRLADAFEVTVETFAQADVPLDASSASPFYTLHFPENCLTLLERYGQLPLPPYIARAPELIDQTRYQTIYAAQPGAVAAPTAGLHFDEAFFAQLDARGVRRATLTLHVGAGTFQPVRTENLAAHPMHSEWYHVPPSLVAEIAQTRAAGKQVIAVGTTSLRALEAAANAAESSGAPTGTLCAGSAETNIFITPGYRFRLVDRLVTNFHLPKSTLFMLVCAFAGFDTMHAAYQHAIEQRYRFFSYGDAMLLTRPSC